jgi:hypothetical protein
MTEFNSKTLQADFCVVGGGLAGTCAALAAARNGLKTILVQDRPVLGGNASSEIRMWICGAQGDDDREAGILEELMLRNLHENPRRLYSRWDHVLYGTCIEEPNLTVLLNSTVMDLSTENHRITGVRAWHMSQQCFFNIEATLFADCSGDSVLRFSGAEWRRGREAREEHNESLAPATRDNKTMGSSILIQLRETDQHEPFVRPDWAYQYTDETVPEREFIPDGHNFWWLEVGGTKDTIANADEIRDELLKIAYGIWAYIKNHPDGRARNWELDWIGSLPGKRENVRYLGDHTLNQNDIRSEGRFNDMVAHGGWPMDEHHPDGFHHHGNPTVFHGSPSPYGIPYRSLYSRNIENLFFAGRNISASHMALSSTRVMATCAVMGQAVGTAASIASKKGLTPRDVYEEAIDELQHLLMEQDAYLPWHTRSIPALSRNASLTASCGDPAVLLDGIERDLSAEAPSMPEGDPDSPENRKKKKPRFTNHGWWAGEGDWVAYNWSNPEAIESVRIVLDSDLSMDKRMLCRYPKDQPPASMPPMLARDLDIECCDRRGNWHTTCEIRDNRKRLIQLHQTQEGVTGCRLRIVRTWGDRQAHVMAFDVTNDPQ